MPIHFDNESTGAASSRTRSMQRKMNACAPLGISVHIATESSLARTYGATCHGHITVAITVQNNG